MRLDLIAATGLRTTLRHLLPLLRRERALVALGLLAVFVEVLATLAEPWPLKIVIDEIVPAALAGEPLPNGTVLGLPALAVLAAAGLLLAVGLRAAAAYAATVCFATVGSRVTIRLRAAAYQKLLRQSLRYHQSGSSGDLLSRLTADITRLQEVAVTAGLPLLGNVVTFAGMAVVMVVLDPVLALVVLVAVPLFLAAMGRAGERVTAAAREQRRTEGRLAGQVGETLAAVRVVQAYRLEDALAARFDTDNVAGLRSGVRSQRLAAGLERRTDRLVGAATAIILLIG
ncbi:MAG: ABC transporter transmembrane domain-containing protein, partial [Pseudonocardia sp.]